VTVAWRGDLTCRWSYLPEIMDGTDRFFLLVVALLFVLIAAGLVVSFL
jgi:hypothetical protein